MSHISKIFEEAPIRVQNRNGFDLSHTHSGSSKCGQLVPVLTKLIAPNSTISLGVDAEVNLPPFVAPFFGKIDFAIEGFITPLSILYGGWKQFITNNDPANFPSSQQFLLTDKSDPTIIRNNKTEFGKAGYALPVFPLVQVGYNDRASFNTLSGTNDNIYDYMGLNLRSFITWSDTDDINISLMPALCYHKICDVFYRNTKLTNTWFAVNPDIVGASNYAAAGSDISSNPTYGRNVSLIWHSFYTDSNIFAGSSSRLLSSTCVFSSNNELTFPDGISVFSTRQRNYSRDYFTSAVASPQQGGASTLKFAVDVSTAGSETGSFTINSLRMANSLQKFLETNNLSGEYADMMRNRWGVRPIDADFDEPHYLGRVVVPVYQHTIFKQDSMMNDSPAARENPFVADGLLGSNSSNGRANGEGSICDNFNVSCWSYLMCIASLYPHSTYNYGMNRELAMTKLGDFPAPELQSVGMEDIRNYEISTSGNSVSAWNSTFGYIPRYSRFKYVDDHCSGELRPGKTMSMYQIQRDFGTSIPQLGTDFVTIAQNALDNVLAVNTSKMKLSCWWEIYFKLHVVMPLADFCIPTLGELGDTHTIKTKVGGSRLS